MRINHNIQALNSYRNLSANQTSLSKTLEKLSSGLRINRAADDAAGLTISHKMRGQIRGLDQAERNILDGISLVQTAEGGLSNIQEMTQRMRELAVQASNDTLTEEDRQAIQDEIEELKNGVNDIANNTEFNGIHLLNRNNSSLELDPDNGGTPPPNTLASPPVDENGRFFFGTENGYATTSMDDNQRLVFESFNTSFPQIEINGTVNRIIDHLSQGTITNDGVYQTTYQVDEVQITQYVEITGNQKDKYEIRYDIKNTSAEAKSIGFQFHLDTMLGNDDRAPFIVNGDPVSNQTTYTGDSIPAEFIVYNQNTGDEANAEFQAHGIIKSTNEFEILEEPSKFAIGRYNLVNNWGFNDNTGIVGDSGYSLWWDAREIASGASFSVNTFYGQSVPPDVDGPSNDSTDSYDVILQVGANEGDEFKIDLTDARTIALGIDDINTSTRQGAEAALTKLDGALQKISSERSKYGAYQNALEHIYTNVTNSGENATASESRISDADMALEMTEFTKRNILIQSGQAMLAQSNQLPQGILELLK
ncbi:flagellin [Domibacillus indicus]|uniref:flagellin N-terminal helical domain-containing protein n=1 Tax=Domibacillus indicus TaxID=1437523 RepID=UPI00203DB84F|nr:flagellin [Domibacillus indicus]MCM3788414.1 flagellin [Domibacillus indicus]